MRYLAWALVLGACGDVAVKVDGGGVDAAPDALVCSATELACSGSCIDPMSTADHCGSCETACQAAGSLCMAGHCVDNIKSCAQIHLVNPAAPSGFYNFLDGAQLYCDMVGLKGYEGPLLMGQYDSNPAGYTIVSNVDLADAGAAGAFVALYNQNGGLKVVTAFTAGNCCFKNDTTAVSNMLYLSNGPLFTATAGALNCFPAGGYTTATTFQFQITAGAVFATPPLAADFFTTHPATTVANCSVVNNPAMFWKVIP